MLKHARQARSATSVGFAISVASAVLAIAMPVPAVATGDIGEGEAVAACGSGVCTGAAAGTDTASSDSADGSTAEPVVSGSSARAVCMDGGKVIPCTMGDAWWSSEYSCYASVAANPPPKSDPVWGGHTNGAVYECAPDCVAGGSATHYCVTMRFWSATPPEGAVAPTDPRAVVERELDSFPFETAEIRTSPRTSAVTFVNLDTWLWIPQSQWHEKSLEVGAGGATVAISASPVRVDWDLSESEMSCDGPGRAWTNGTPEAGFEFLLLSISALVGE